MTGKVEEVIEPAPVDEEKDSKHGDVIPVSYLGYFTHNS
jgi:hypothetical protein